jgi:predicted nuclease with TOPRIM domain
MQFRAENNRLRTSNEHMKCKLDQLTRQCHELSNRLTQQGHLQEKMRERLHDMDGEIQLSSQQVTQRVCVLWLERRTCNPEVPC